MVNTQIYEPGTSGSIQQEYKALGEFPSTLFYCPTGKTLSLNNLITGKYSLL